MTDPVTAAVLLCQVAVLATLVEALRRGNAAAAINALAAVVVVMLPTLAGVVFDVDSGPYLGLWLGVALLLHVSGMLGPYETVWWWDHLTHGLSGALVAALLYAGLLVAARGVEGPAVGPGTVAAATVIGVLVIGVAWELLELVARDVGERLDVEPVLVHYGVRDTSLDLAFDLLGALVVVLLDLQVFVPLADSHAGAVRPLLVWGGGAIVAWCGLVGGLLAANRLRAGSPADDK